jgi:lysophospholipase L1-like esterase
MPLNDRSGPCPRGITPIMVAALSLFVVAHAMARTTCPRAVAEHLSLPAVRAALAHGQPVTIVALGSSSTKGVGASAPDRTYPARLAAFLRAAWPHSSVTVLNRGVGGQEVNMMVRRLDHDVLAVKPVLVVWQAGANAAMHGMDPTQFAALLDEGVRRIKAHGADVVLMDNQIAPKIERAPHHAIYDEDLAREARARHISLFSRTALMRAWQTDDPAGPPMIGPDGVHHTDLGYACVAAALGQSILDAASSRSRVVTAGK